MPFPVAHAIAFAVAAPVNASSATPTEPSASRVMIAEDVVERMAELYQVSTQAMTLRLHRLDLIR